MKTVRCGSARLLISLALLLVAAGCANQHHFPSASLTGKMVEAQIGDDLKPKNILANLNDEVRWVNTADVPIDLYFVDPLNDRVTCEKGFTSTGWGYLFASSEAEYIIAAVVHPNQFVSLCFSTPGSYAYVAKRETTPTGKSIKMTGTVTIQPARAPAVQGRP